DLFKFDASDSGTVAGSLDQIRDWESTDTIDFTNAALVAGNGTNYALEATAPDYATAKAAADSAIAGGVIDYYVVQVGTDVVVFADSNNDNGTADDAVVLVGRSLNDIGPGNIV